MALQVLTADGAKYMVDLIQDRVDMGNSRLGNRI